MLFFLYGNLHKFAKRDNKWYNIDICKKAK